MTSAIHSPAFRTVALDPPWLERGSGKVKRGADRHYALMSRWDILRTVLNAEPWGRVESVAHCYLWVTNNYLPDGLWLMDALGFTYKTNVVWVKPRIGIGRYFRGQHELMLFGVRGTGAFGLCSDRRDLPSAIVTTGKRGRHSKKPDEARALIEARSRGPYLEMFARDCADGWSAWGNEVDQ